ncbi:cupin domain-containing protein [Pelagibius sp.]|uniref:cupin domain-containing protein n=1 Tax=Pelagibius sp. TaxID=1931238 RepID=UPI0026398A03|nr:cupin domain-containing protein [Pelagibius sp.]
MASGRMTKDELDLLAAEYVLGTLDPEARARTGKSLATDMALQEAVQRWEQRLSGLAAEPGSEEPPSAVWEGIEAAIESSGAGGPVSKRERFSIAVRASEGEWKPVAEGIEKKSLFIDREEGFEAFLLRFAAGAVLPPHPHRMTEECIVLEGEVEIGGVRLTAGDYHVISAGVPHPAISSPKGGLFYVRGELRNAG